MRQRTKFALEDIRYIQTEIEKILNRDKHKLPQRIAKQNEPKQRGENKFALISGGRANYSTSPIKSKSKPKEKSLSNGKAKSKGKKKKKKSEQDDFVDPFFKYLQMKSIPQEPHSKHSKQQAIKIQKFEQPKQSQRQQNSKKSIMELWKQRQKQSYQFHQIQKNSLSPKQNSTKKAQASQSFSQRQEKKSSQSQVDSNISPRRHFQTESADESSQVIVFEKSREIPYHLNPKNEIPLRSDTSYLINKYHPEGQPSARGKQLKEKYWKLDQRLERLQQQVRNRPVLPFKQPCHNEDLRQSKKAKKYALADYYHHSPVLKFVRINEKLRGDYERSLKSQERRARQKSQDLQREWVS